MRVTTGRIKLKNQAKMQEMFERVKAKFGFIDLHIVEDMYRILENPEALMRHPVLFRKTLKEYQEGKVDDIFEAYYARLAYSRFLKMMAESPHYPKDAKQNESFFNKMWELLAELWEKDLPTMNQMLLGQGGNSGGGQSGPKTKQQEGVESLSKLVDYGQKILELLRDPLFAKAFPRPQPPKKGDKDGDSEEESDAAGDSNAQGTANPAGGTSQTGDGDSEEDEDEEDSDDQGGGDGSSTGGSQAGRTSTLDTVHKKLTTWNPYMVDAILMSENLSFVTRFNKLGEWAPTPYPDNNLDIHKIKSSADLPKLLPSQYALPSDIFYLRYVKQELQCREFMAKQERKQIAYILLDVSCSMQTQEKVQMVGSVALALLRKVTQSGDKYFLRFFDYHTSQLHQATNLDEAQGLAKKVIERSFDGAGTSIHTALTTAIDDIKKAAADPKANTALKDCQILLLTDGEDSVNPAAINMLKGKIKIHSVVVHNRADPKLKDLSDTYYEVKPGQEGKHALELVKLLDNRKKK